MSATRGRRLSLRRLPFDHQLGDADDAVAGGLRAAAAGRRQGDYRQRWVQERAGAPRPASSRYSITLPGFAASAATMPSRRRDAATTDGQDDLAGGLAA